MARSWILLFFFGITLTQAANCRRGTCNADNCLRAVRASGFPSVHGSADCSKYLATTVTAPGSTTTTTTVDVITPTVTDTAVVTDVSTSVDVVPSTTVISTFDVTTVTTASYTTVTVTTTTSVTIAAANQKRQPTASSPASSASGATPPYATACSGFLRYSSACSCIGVTAQTYTATGPASTVTVALTSTTVASTVIVTATQSTATTVTSISGVVSLTSITATLTSTVYSTTLTSTSTAATATIYSFAIEAQYPPGGTNDGNYFAAAQDSDAYFFDAQSTTSQQTTFNLNSITGHLTVTNGAASGNMVSYGTGGSGSFVVVYNPGTVPLSCSIGDDNELDCQQTNPSGASVFGVCGGPGGALFVYPSGYSNANCQGAFSPATLYAIPPMS